MGWIDQLSKLKLKLVEAKADIKTEQLGLINITVESNTYNYPVNDSEVLKHIKEIPSEQIEDLVKKEVERQLAPLSPILNRLSDSTSSEVIAATAVNTLGINKAFGE